MVFIWVFSMAVLLTFISIVCLQPKNDVDFRETLPLIWALSEFSRGVWLQTSTHTLQTSTHRQFRCRQKHPPTRRKLRAGGCLERELHIIQQRPLGSHFSVGRRIRCNNGTHCTKMWRSAQLHLEVMVGDYSKHSDTIINARDLHFFSDLLVSLSLDFFIKQITERYTNMKHLF